MSPLREPERTLVTLLEPEHTRGTLLEPERPRFSTLFRFLLVSIGLHMLLLLWLRGATLSVGDLPPPPVVVKLAPAPAEPKPARQQVAKAPAIAQPDPSRQIVAPSDQENDLVPDGRAFLSDRNNRVDKETIKKGNPEAGQPAQPQPPAPAPQQPPSQVASAPRPAPPPAPKPAAPAPERAARPPVQKAPPRRDAKPSEQRAGRQVPPPRDTRQGETTPQPLPGLRQLFAPPEEVLAKAERDRRAAGGAAARPGAADDPRKDLVSAPPPAPGIFGGLRGSFDNLPDVAQGNLTMLNTKADRFAPFVRRVGTRVFQNLLIYQRQNLEASDIIAASDLVTVHVTLDSSGRLKDLEVEEHSGSMAVDQTLIDALRQAAFDDNPPKAAANDRGEYHFVFQAQLLAGVGQGPGGPELRTVESRLRIGLL